MRKHEDVYRKVILRRDAGERYVRKNEHRWEYIVGTIVCAAVVLVMVQIIPRTISPSDLENTTQTETESESKTEKPTIKESQYDLDKVIWGKENTSYHIVEYKGILMHEEIRNLIERGEHNSIIAIVIIYEPSEEEPKALINKLEKLGEVRSSKDDISGKITLVEALLPVEQFEKIDAADVAGHKVLLQSRVMYETYSGYYSHYVFAPK